jgi:hypothetical protein
MAVFIQRHYLDERKRCNNVVPHANGNLDQHGLLPHFVHGFGIAQLRNNFAKRGQRDHLGAQPVDTSGFGITGDHLQQHHHYIDPNGGIGWSEQLYVPMAAKRQRLYWLDYRSGIVHNHAVHNS